MKKLTPSLKLRLASSPLKLTAFITLIIFIGLAIYPAHIYMEWKREQVVLKELGIYNDLDIYNIVWFGNKYSWATEMFPADSRLSQYFVRCLQLDLTQEAVSNDQLSKVKVFGDLYRIELGEGYNSDALARVFQEMPQLVDVVIEGNDSLNGESFMEITNLPHLCEVGIRRCPTGDTALKHLSSASTLQVLFLELTGVSDSGLAQYSATPPITLYLFEESITTNGLLNFLEHADPKLQEVILPYRWATMMSNDHIRLKDTGFAMNDDPIFGYRIIRAEQSSP